MSATAKARRIIKKTFDAMSTTANTAPHGAPLPHDPSHRVQLNNNDYFYRTIDGRYYGHIGLWNGYAEEFLALFDTPAQNMFIVGEETGVHNLKKLLTPYLQVARLLVAEEHIHRPMYTIDTPRGKHPTIKGDETVERPTLADISNETCVTLDKTDTQMFTHKEEQYTLYRVVATRNIFMHNVKAGDLGGYVTKNTSITGNGWVDNSSIMIGGSVSGAGLVAHKSFCYNSRISGRVINSELINSTVHQHGVILSSHATDSNLNGNMSESRVRKMATFVNSTVNRCHIGQPYTAYMESSTGKAKFRCHIGRPYTAYMDEVLDGVRF